MLRTEVLLLTRRLSYPLNKKNRNRLRKSIPVVLLTYEKLLFPYNYYWLGI